MGVGAVIGALVGLGATGALAGAGIFTVFGVGISTLWMVGASLGSLFDRPSLGGTSSNYSLDPVRNSMSQLLPVPVVYGRCRVAGNQVYQQFEDNTRLTVFMHVVLSEGPITSVGYGDVYVNDTPTVDLSEVTKYVYKGDPDQAATPFDPEGLSYPYTAMVSLKISASEKVQGTPTVTTVLTGRDIDYPGKGSAGSFLPMVLTASDGFTHSGALGYSDAAVTIWAMGYEGRYREVLIGDNDNGPIYRDYPCYLSRPTLTLFSLNYTDLSKGVVLLIPMVFEFEEYDGSYDPGFSHVFKVEVYPDDAQAEHHDFTGLSVGGENSMSQNFIRQLDNGMAIHWEKRKTRDESDERTYYSGVLQVKIPMDLLPASGRAKVVFIKESETYAPTPLFSGDGRELSEDRIFCGLLDYTDVALDSPWTGFVSPGGLNSPVWAVYDILTNRRYGAGIPTDFIDGDSFAVAAARCEQDEIQLNLVLDQQKSVLDHLKDMLGVCRGYLLLRDKIRFGMDAPVDSYTRIITADDIIEGSFEYWTTSLDQVPNQVTVEYVDGDEDGEGTWEQVSCTIEDWEDMDSRGIYEKRFSMLGITRASQAKTMANYLFESFRRCRIYCSFLLDLAGSDVEVGDVVAVTFDLPGWTEKFMRVVSVTDEPAGFISVTCLEYDEVVFETADDI